MKKNYLEPQLEVVEITGQQLFAYSGGDTEADVLIDPNPSMNDGPNL